jgi:MFS family permease
LLGAVNGLFFTGGAFGSVTQGWVSDKIGRKRALILGSTLALIGTAFVAGTAHIGMLIAFRFVQGWGMGMIVTLAPLYLAEISPPHRRGLVVGAFAFSLGLGTNIVGWVSLGTFYAKNKSVQWRLPLALACLAPIAMVIGAFFIPESPRWLIWNGRNETARQILRRLHKDGSDDTDTAADAEFTQIKRQVEIDTEMRVTYWELFRKPSHRKRTLIVIITMFAYQSTGAFGIGNYKVLIYENLGFSGGMPLLLNALYTLSGTLAIGMAALIMDKTGRKILLCEFKLFYL